MTSAEHVSHQCGSSERATPRLEDLIPVAVVIGAGCERCAEGTVEQALRRGSAKRLIERTLGIVAHLRSQDCFVEAVGPDVIPRMEKALEAGKKALREADPPTKDRECCG